MKMRSTIILISLSLLLVLTNSYVIKPINNNKYINRNTLLNMAQIRYELKNEKELVKKSNMIFLAPMNNFSMEEAELFKKSIPENWEYSVLTGNKVLEAIDGTPFCLLSSIISSSNFCIFVFDDDSQKSNEILNTCLNKVLKISKSSNYEYAICRKGHLIYINESEMKKSKKGTNKYREKEKDLSDDDKMKFIKVSEMDENDYMNQLQNLIERI